MLNQMEEKHVDTHWVPPEPEFSLRNGASREEVLVHGEAGATSGQAGAKDRVDGPKVAKRLIYPSGSICFLAL